MNKERLEELKKMRLLYEVCFVDEYASAIDDVTADFDLLIKRVQELEVRNKELIEGINFNNKEYGKIIMENKRYREALESILNNDQMYITNEEIILKVLEVEK